jgi:hypothetical protein
MNPKTHTVAAWSGLVFVILFGIGWALLGGFVPPPSPSMGTEEIATFYQTDNSLKILGLCIVMIAIALLVPFMGLISIQMARIEGKWPILALCAAICAVINIIYFVLPVFFWITAAYRPEQSSEIMRVFNDIAWIIIMWPFSTTVLQNCLFGYIILSDKRQKPLFPRWTGYFTICEAFLILPGGLVPFFKSGPFAWNGLLAFWVVAISYLSWIIVMSIYLNKSVAIATAEEVAQNSSN